ncbi:hypothetical protein BDN67DRAFT_969070 [Paxillus ammoniavirescens]|nr:hypothetical protein BDN67DRAFT_969070 [Paxillus ammoniavirescens]
MAQRLSVVFSMLISLPPFKGSVYRRLIITQSGPCGTVTFTDYIQSDGRTMMRYQIFENYNPSWQPNCLVFPSPDSSSALVHFTPSFIPLNL